MIQPHPSLQTDVSDSVTPRASQRIRQEAVLCNLGSLRDLSTSGMRVETRTVPRGPVDVQLYALDQSVVLKGKVAWSRPLGHFKFEVGIRFGRVSRQQARELTALARLKSGRRFL